MKEEEAAQKILDTMLGHLGFAVNIEVQQTDDGPCLQILTGDSKPLIGKDGQRLDDFQYLVNRILKKHFPEAPRYKIDCEHYRSMQEHKLIEEIKEIAERVKATGKPIKVRPLNAYYRRIAHNALEDVAEVQSVSPKGDQRLKQITIKLHKQKEKEKES